LSNDWTQLIKADLRKLDATVSGRNGSLLRFREGERRHVAIFFCDIKGFSSLSAEMDPDDLAEIMELCNSMFSKIIEKYGGHVEKYAGDLIMALFGSTEASENDCERAVLSGLDFLQILQKINMTLESRCIKLDSHIGIHVGLVVTGRSGLEKEGDFTEAGEAVKLASILESNAPVNRILISEDVRELVQMNFLCKFFSDLKIKGFIEKIPAYTVEKQKLTCARWERPTQGSLSPFIGRQKEMLKLENLYLLSMVRSQMLGIVAQAGVGKSRLVFEFVSNIQKENRDFSILRGNTLHYVKSPYFCFISMLKRFFGIGDESDVRVKAEMISAKIREVGLQSIDRDDFLEEKIPLIKYLFGADNGDRRILELEPKPFQLQIQLALRILFEHIAIACSRENGHPLVIIVEDLQWIDEASAELLQHMTEKFPENLFLVYQYRPNYKVPACFREKSYFSEMELGRLSPESSKLILESMLPGIMLPVELMDEIIQKSDGNPFYAEELVHSLIVRKMVVRKGEAWMVTREIAKLEVPVTLRALILSRIDQLPPELKTTLQRASVIGHEFLLRVLSRVAEMTSDVQEEIKQYLELLINLNLIFRKTGDKEDSYFFKHLLTRDVAYSTLLHYNRKLLHRLTGETIEKLFPENIDENLSLLAYHFHKAAIVDKALAYFQRAIDRARKFNNVREGLTLTMEAISLAMEHKLPIEEKLGFYFSQEEFLAHFGLREKQLQCLETIEGFLSQTTDHLSQSELYCRYGTYYLGTGKLDAAHSFSEKALTLKNELDDWKGLGQVIRNLGVLEDHLGNYDRALELYGQGLEIADKCGDLSSKCKHLGNIELIHFQRGNMPEAIRYFEEVQSLSEEIGDEALRAKLLHQLGHVKRVKEEYQSAIGHYEQSLKISREIGFKAELPAITGDIGNVYLETKSYDLALKYFKEALEYSIECSDKRHESNWLLNIGAVKLLIGLQGESVQKLKTARKISLDIGDIKNEIIAIHWLGKHALELGDFPGCRKLIDSADHLNERFNNFALESELRLLEFDMLIRTGRFDDCFTAIGNFESKAKDRLDNLPGLKKLLTVIGMFLAAATGKKLQVSELRAIVGDRDVEDHPQYIEIVYYAWQTFRMQELPEALIYHQVLYDDIQSVKSRISRVEHKESFLKNVFKNREILSGGGSR